MSLKRKRSDFWSIKFYKSIFLFIFINIFSATNAQEVFERVNYCPLAAKIYAAYEEKNFVYIKEVRSKNENDAFIFPTCQLLLLLANKLPVKEFIDAFPKNKDEYYLFASRAWGCENLPQKIFNNDEDHPIFAYYDELLKLMAKGDRRAMKKVLNSIPWVDGEMAENLLWEELPKFLLKHPDIVLKNWDLFKDHINSIDSDIYTEDVYKNLIYLNKIVQETAADSVSKEGFLKYLDREVKIHKKYKGFK